MKRLDMPFKIFNRLQTKQSIDGLEREKAAHEHARWVDVDLTWIGVDELAWKLIKAKIKEVRATMTSEDEDDVGDDDESDDFLHLLEKVMCGRV